MRTAPSSRKGETTVISEQATRIAALLHEAGETHRLVYRIVDGDDPDWASWYADWLISLSELPQILKTKPVRSELVWLLVTVDKEYTEASPGIEWPHWYAERIVERLGAAGGQALRVAPQEIVIEFLGRGDLEAVNMDPLWIHAAHDMPDRAVLARGIERLQND